ncbi:MAG: response regulator [Candidatus Firestonebacteria bacterium]
MNMELEKLYSKGCGEMSADKKQIYIVDDDESVCRALKCLLMTFGFEVNTFLSAEEFFSAVPDSAQGSLIMDIHMKGLSGWDALKRITKSGFKRPVIIISADKNGGLREQAIKFEAVGFLQKPVNDQELIDLINKTYYMKKMKENRNSFSCPNKENDLKSEVK